MAWSGSRESIPIQVSPGKIDPGGRKAGISGGTDYLFERFNVNVGEGKRMVDGLRDSVTRKANDYLQFHHWLRTTELRSAPL